jgi:glycosyltransferase involved in cell wall biosynthesis
MVTIGVHLHSDPGRLRATLASLARHAADATVILLPDAPEPDVEEVLRTLGAYPRLDGPEPGAPAAFNRLIGFDETAVVVFLESGVVLTRGALPRLVAAVTARPEVGLAGPSTNFVWNEQCLRPAPSVHAGPERLAVFAEAVAARFGDDSQTLEPLYSLADFAYVVKRAVIRAIGGADERYGQGPCWEMDYNVRAARAGFAGVWVKGAYVHRPPHTARRAREEARHFTTSKQLYQDKFCGARLRGAKADYRDHCRGDACPNFAPAGLVRPVAPLPPAPPAPPARTVARRTRDPLVTCAMPTCDRRAFVPLAIRFFQRQDYPRLELLILDDGVDPVGDCVPDDPRVRYIRLDGRHSVGAKRNLACAEARGEIIVHWDDDDWYPPSRVSRQVHALVDRPAEVCGSSRLLFFDPAAERAWSYEYVAGHQPWVAGTTLAYRKDVWSRNPFPDAQVGEDARFLWSGAVKTVADLADPTLCVGIIHPGNTSRKDTTGTYWCSSPRARVEALLGEDLRFYRGLLQPASALPLVSCIMPTFNRRRFVELALRGFARQDYPRKELVVIDDGTDPVGDLVEGVPGARYIRLGRRASIGAKRNLACAEARGEIIAHWDDDDWYAPDRLRYQTTPVVAGEADLTGLQGAFVLELPAAQFWTIDRDLHRRMYVGDVHGGTLVYRKTLWEEGLKYPEINLAEDATLLHHALARGKRLQRLANTGVFVYVRHGGNAWAFQPGQFLDQRGWTRIPRPAVFSLELLDDYAAALTQSSPAPGRVHARG